MSQHRRWIGFTLKFVVNALLDQCEPERRELFLAELLRYYGGRSGWTPPRPSACWRPPPPCPWSCVRSGTAMSCWTSP